MPPDSTNVPASGKVPGVNTVLRNVQFGSSIVLPMVKPLMVPPSAVAFASTSTPGSSNDGAANTMATPAATAPSRSSVISGSAVPLPVRSPLTVSAPGAVPVACSTPVPCSTTLLPCADAGELGAAVDQHGAGGAGGGADGQ